MAQAQDKNKDEIKVETLTNKAMTPIKDEWRFALLTLGCFGTVCVAVGSAFNLVSQPLQQRYHLSMRELTTIVTVGQVFKYFMLPYGIGYDYLGPIFTSILGATVFPLGATLFCLCFRGNIDGTVPRLCVFQAIFNVGCVMFDTTCMVTTVNHFPTNRGLVIAFLSTHGSLGGSMVACIYSAFFAVDISKYFFFLIAYGLLVGILCALFMKHPSYYLTGLEKRSLTIEEKEKRTQYKAQYLRQKPTMYRFIYAGSIMIFLIIVLPVQSCVIAYKGLGQTYKLAFAILVMVCAFLMLFTAVPFHKLRRLCFKPDAKPNNHYPPLEGFEEVEGPIEMEKSVTGIESLPQRPDAEKHFDKVARIETDVDYIAPQYQTSFWRNLLTLHLWAMLWSLFAIVGTESTVISNASHIYGAMHEKQVNASERAMLTAINGSCSAVGRLSMSALEIWTQHRAPEKRIPLTATLFIASSAVLLSCVFFVSLPPSAAIVPFITLAFGNGFQMASTFLVMRTIYAKDLAAHYNFCLLATSIAAIVCNRFLFGEWYAVQAEKMGSLVCLKKKCIFMPFMIMGGLACTSFLASFYVHLSYRRFSRKVLEERARILRDAGDTMPKQGTPQGDPEEEQKQSTIVGQFYATGALEDQLEADLQEVRSQ